MRAGLSTIQQTLTPEAATVLNQSISEASRRNHGQTTPLHVAATLLSSPSQFLRQACIRSHPNSSHPLQCRALELCFSVALERLPTAQNGGSEPPISNALMAALKRAQAHQRRGCPEQQQQPLLAVKVELEQLVISILDDPSVSRVMREASFSSPAVKAAIEQSLNTSNNPHHPNVGFGPIGTRLMSNPAQSKTPVNPLANRNMYLNPRLQQGSIGQTQTGNQRGEEIKKVLEILLRNKKRNPVLVGDTEPEALLNEILSQIEKKELGSDGILKDVQILSMDKALLSDKNQISSKIEELYNLIENRIKNGGVILDLGDLKWLVEQPVSFNGGVQLHQKQQIVSEMGRLAVIEMAKLLARFNDGDNKLWLIGTATCETYLRCQVYHSTMENDWDLQAVPIASRSPRPGIFPRFGTERLLSSPLESLNTMKSIQPSLPVLTRRLSENSNSTFCPRCSENYEKELSKLAAIEKSFSESKQEKTRPSLPQWLQNAKQTTDQSQENNQGGLSKHKTQELQKKWRDTCLNLHPSFHHDSRPAKTGPLQTSLFNANLLSRPPFEPKLHTNKPLGEALHLNTTQLMGRPVNNPLGQPINNPPGRPVNNPPGSPVRTDLVLGSKDTVSDDQAKDFLGCISSEPHTKLSEPQIKLLDKFANALDADTYKKLLKGLMEKAWWQAEAASEVASAITRCRLGNGKRRGGGSRGDIWLLFTGPDRVGKKKMASVLADQVCGANPIMICLGSRRDDEESNMNFGFRGKTAIDRIAEAVRRNPFSVIMLEDIDEADMLVRGSIKRAIERGRLTDSHGREVGLGNAVFIVTGDWSTANREIDGHFLDEKKLASIASGGWQLGLIVREKSAKRRANWLHDGDRRSKQRREAGPDGLSLDLNLAVGDPKDGKNDTSFNSSDLTVDHEDDLALANRHFAVTSVPHELVSSVDDSIVFRPVDLAFVRCEIKKTISVKFSMVFDNDMSIEVEDDVLEKILGGLWHDRTGLEEWIENVLAPSFEQLKPRLPAGDHSGLVVRLVVESGFVDRGKRTSNEDWLPSSIVV